MRVGGMEGTEETTSAMITDRMAATDGVTHLPHPDLRARGFAVHVECTLTNYSTNACTLYFRPPLSLQEFRAVEENLCK